MTVINSKYETSLTPGGSDSFVMTMKADSLGEVNKALTVTMDTGNCSPWVTTSVQGLILDRTGTPVKASIAVPGDAYNGKYQCKVLYTTGEKGFITSEIYVPVTITVSGGKLRPAATSTPTQAPSPIPSAKQPETLKSPDAEETLKETPAAAPQQEPVMGIPFGIYGALAIGAISVLFIVTIIYDYRRGRKG